MVFQKYTNRILLQTLTPELNLSKDENFDPQNFNSVPKDHGFSEK